MSLEQAWPVAAVTFLLTAIVFPQLAWAVRHPFLIANWLQWLLSDPLRHVLRDRSADWPRRLWLALAPIEIVYWVAAYVALAPLRLLNAIYFDMVLFWSVTLRDSLMDLVAPAYRRHSRWAYARAWVRWLPQRLLRVLQKLPLALGQGILTTCFDLLWPTLTLFHGTSERAAIAIARSNAWRAGGGDYAGTGIYFGLWPRVAQHYARHSDRAPYLLSRVTLEPCRAVATLPRDLRKRVGRWAGDAISQGVRSPWVSLEHWRADRGWYEFCVLQPRKHSLEKPWRVRPICLISGKTAERVPRGLALWPHTRRGAAVLVSTLLCALLPVGLYLLFSTGLVPDITIGSAIRQTLSGALLMLPEGFPSANCPGAPPIRVSAGKAARVLDLGSASLRLRAGPGTAQGAILAELPARTILRVRDGPRCADGYAWWQVDVIGGGAGWVAEGSSGAYFIEPVP